VVDSDATPKIACRDVYKIFGPRPEAARDLVDQGKTKAEILHDTGMTVGVCDASLEINEGEIFVVMGLSGSGKSTLVRLLNRLIEPTFGAIEVEGTNIVDMPQRDLIELRRKRMAMVFQSFALMPHRTVLDNAAFGLEVAGFDRATRYERATKAIETVGLGANVTSYPSELSGGMKQRVGLARALANDPAIMLMDEAFSALDPLIRTEMQDELLRIQRESPRTIVFISHDLDEAMRIGDRIAVMESGRIVQTATPQDIVINPANDYVRSFFKGVDVSKVFAAGDICEADVLPTTTNGAGSATATVLLDGEHRYRGMAGDGAATEPLSAGTPLSELLHVVANASHPVPVVGDDGRYLGAISQRTLLQTLDRTR
jgi:glycine betaine/proline transport system ATP-binding protein